MNFFQYIRNFVILPYYSMAKIFFVKKSFAYNLFVFLNLVWIVFLFAVTMVGVLTCFL